MNESKSHQICLPVTPYLGRFVPDPAQSDSLQDLPFYSEMSSYLERHYRLTRGSVEWKGINLDANVYVPNDANDCAYAIVDYSLFESQSEATKRPSSQALKALDSWTANNLSYCEPAPMGNATRLRTEFVEIRLREWDGKNPVGPTVSWRELLNRSKLVIVGGPGSGKTSLLRNIVIHETKRVGGSSWWRLPIYMQLRDIGECSDLLSLARATLDYQTSLKTTADFDLAFSAGRLLLILDGLDELSDDHRLRWTEQIVRLSREYPSIGIYISTRPSGYQKPLAGFLHAHVQPFDQMQIQEWLRLRLARSNETITAHLQSALTTDADLENLASTPLTLSLIASVYERTGIIPRRKADLIARYLETVLETWDASRSVRRYKVAFLKEDKLEALSLAAVYAWQAHRLCFTESDFCSLQQSWSPFRKNEAAHRVLRDCGLFALNETEHNTWTFTHEVFRDYLVAIYLVQSSERITDWLANRDDDTKHFRLWRHACGITNHASTLFQALIATPQMNPYDKAHWLLAALCDGVNVPEDDVRSATTQIMAALQSGIEGRYISDLEMKDGAWRLLFRGSDVTTRALSEIVKLIITGGWQSSEWLVEPLRHAQSAIARSLSSLLKRAWKIKTEPEPNQQLIRMVASEEDKLDQI